MELLGVRQRNFYLIPLATRVQGKERGDDRIKVVVWVPLLTGNRQETKRLF